MRGHAATFHRILWKLVEYFLRNPANKQTTKRRQHNLLGGGKKNNRMCYYGGSKFQQRVLHLALSIALLFALCWHFANKYMDGWMEDGKSIFDKRHPQVFLSHPINRGSCVSGSRSAADWYTYTSNTSTCLQYIVLPRLYYSRSWRDHWPSNYRVQHTHTHSSSAGCNPVSYRSWPSHRHKSARKSTTSRQQVVSCCIVSAVKGIGLIACIIVTSAYRRAF